MDFTFLWVSTISMLVFSISMITFVVWTTKTLRKEREFYFKRDAYFVQRMEEIESLVRKEFSSLIVNLKKI